MMYPFLNETKIIKVYKNGWRYMRPFGNYSELIRDLAFVREFIKANNFVEVEPNKFVRA
jgi:hypothetical protein